MTTLLKIMDVLYSAGVPMTGSLMSDDEALAYARQFFPDGSYCLVRDWSWLDLEVTESERLQRGCAEFCVTGVRGYCCGSRSS